MGCPVTFEQLQRGDQVWLRFDAREFALDIQAARPCLTCQVPVLFNQGPRSPCLLPRRLAALPPLE